MLDFGFEFGPCSVLRVTLVVALGCGASGVFADSAGTSIFSIGWVHLDPRSSSGPLTLTEFAGQPVDRPQVGTGVKVLSANTLVLSYEHFWTDQVSTQLALGIPPRHKLQGTGSLATAGVIGDGQQLSPAVLVKYNFGEAEQRLRPYIGAGLNYTWFRKAHITNDSFRQATYGPAATTELSVSPSWNPVYNVGMNYRLDERWSVGLSVAYAPLKTRITVAADNTSFGAPVKVVTDVRIRTLAIGMNLGYRF